MAVADLHQGNIVEFLADVFDRRGNEAYLGEPVTMAEHMLQGASLAAEMGADEFTIVGALLHDVGHFSGEFGIFSMSDTKDRHHEVAGAKLIEAFFPVEVVDCVRHHVAAKRYLCAVEPVYFDALSEASVHSLQLQGGPMTPEEVRVFAQTPNLERIVQVRRCDDAGKVRGTRIPGFDHYVSLLRETIHSRD